MRTFATQSFFFYFNLSFRSIQKMKRGTDLIPTKTKIKKGDGYFFMNNKGDRATKMTR